MIGIVKTTGVEPATCRLESHSVSIRNMRLRLSSTLGMMGVVACAAVAIATVLALANETGNPLLGMVIVVACVTGVAWLKAADAVRRHRADGNSVTGWQLSTIVLTSAAVATLIVGLADLAFVLGYGLLAGGPRFFLFSADPRSENFIPEGFIAGATLAIALCYLSRWAFWRSTVMRVRFFRGLAPLAVVFALFEANVIWERTWNRWGRAQQHDALAAIYGGESSLPIPRGPDFRGQPELAAYHVRMKRKWEHAATRPWMSVDPDPSPPGP